MGEALPGGTPSDRIAKRGQMSDKVAHSSRSSHSEALLEHLFAGEVMKHLWRRGDWRLEVLKPQVDDDGYDLVLENAIVRQVQLLFATIASNRTAMDGFVQMNAGTISPAEFLSPASLGAIFAATQPAN